MNEGKKRKSPLRFLPVLAVLVAAIVFRQWDAGREQEKAAALIPAVRTEQPQRRDLVELLKIKSHIEADNTVTVLPLVSGILQSVEVQAGDRVVKDQVLARIDPARYELQLSQAEASYLAAKSTFDRIEAMFRANASTQQNYDQARAQADAARSQWELAKLQLGYATLRSPVDGVLLRRNLNAGDFASPERPFAAIGDLSRLVAKAAVPESRYARFARGDVGISVEAGGGTYTASLKSLAPYVSAETRTFEVVCLVEDRALDGRSSLRPGMTATVTFYLDEREGALSLPYASLGYERELWYVEDETARRIDAPALFSDGVYFEVPDSFAGKDFIVEGQHFLSEGQIVKPIGAEQ